MTLEYTIDIDNRVYVIYHRNIEPESITHKYVSNIFFYLDKQIEIF